MLVVCIILGHLAVLIVGQGQLVVLCTVYNALLDGCIYLAESHRSSGSAEGIDHVHAGRALLYTYFLAL